MNQIALLAGSAGALVGIGPAFAVLKLSKCVKKAVATDLACAAAFLTVAAVMIG